MKTVRYTIIASLVLLIGSLVSVFLKRTVVTVVFLAVLVLLLIFLFVQVRNEEQLKEFLIRETKKNSSSGSGGDVMQYENMLKSAYLSALQYQINPHFLYNTLDTIRGQALLEDRKEIAAMAEKLSRFFRYAISNEESMVRLEEEVHHIEDYYYIQKQRFGDRFELVMNIEDPSLNELYIPKLILQPIVENAITHGLEKVKRAGVVSISIYATEEKLILKVTDNGTGIDFETLRKLNESLDNPAVEVETGTGKGTGIAIRNVNARIRLKCGNDYGMHYRSRVGEGTEVLVVLPKVDDFSRIKYEDDKLQKVSVHL